MSPHTATIKLPVTVQKNIAQSQDPQAVQDIVRHDIQLATQAEITFTAVQLQVLTLTHITNINRSKSGTKLPAVDPQMFATVSLKSLDLADQVVRQLGTLADAELYVLSIHFTAAQLKIYCGDILRLQLSRVNWRGF